MQVKYSVKLPTKNVKNMLQNHLGEVLESVSPLHILYIKLKYAFVDAYIIDSA